MYAVMSVGKQQTTLIIIMWTSVGSSDDAAILYLVMAFFIGTNVPIQVTDTSDALVHNSMTALQPRLNLALMNRQESVEDENREESEKERSKEGEQRTDNTVEQIEQPSVQYHLPETSKCN